MISRAKIFIRGAVQGVGFRPFIFKLAKSFSLKGKVYNSSRGVFIEAEGEEKSLKEFVLKIEPEKPPMAFISGMEVSFAEPAGYDSFSIVESKRDEAITTLISPDIAVCRDCLAEMNDPQNHRYNYPFINCTNCGPRFSIIESLPYDRPNTSMKKFPMCEKCREEYENPLDRRFHAQPIACPECGPHIELWDSRGKKLAEKEEALELVARKIKNGKIIALKGLGGFQLLADARNEKTVNLLRERKRREEKPFALMFPSFESVTEACIISKAENKLLNSPESPIVLLKKKENHSAIAGSVAPGNPYLGAMLPYTPLHYLLMKKLNFPIVATSGNISEEPMQIDETEAVKSLGTIADFFLVHNRPIVRPVDDSVVRVIADKTMVLRRARGYAPFPVQIKSGDSKTVLALGGHLKNSIALKIGTNVFVSQHIGDLSNESSFEAFKKIIEDFKLLYAIEPDEIVCDTHPEYLSTKHAKTLGKKITNIGHHYAHVASCRAENRIEGSALGVSWDGTGYGNDGTIWGGEFFISYDYYYSHVARLKQFRLPGGEKAVKEGRRSAAGVLYEIFGGDFFEREPEYFQRCFDEKEAPVIRKMLEKNINSPVTSSAGRLFDAVSSILGISHVSNFEGQSAMKLEFAADHNERGFYPFSVNENYPIEIDWTEMILSILKEKKKGVELPIISARFHNSLSQIILLISEIVEKEKTILSGGCFQNAYLTGHTVKLLTAKNHKVYLNEKVPPNDGGIALGQIAALGVPYENRNNSAVYEISKK